MTGMESGACECGLEQVDGYEAETRKARKRYQCPECNRTIAIGERYVIIKALYEGSWSTTRRCPQCEQIAVDYCCGVVGAGEVWAMVWERLGVDLRTGETRDVAGQRRGTER